MEFFRKNWKMILVGAGALLLGKMLARRMDNVRILRALPNL